MSRRKEVVLGSHDLVKKGALFVNAGEGQEAGDYFEFCDRTAKARDKSVSPLIMDWNPVSMLFAVSIELIKGYGAHSQIITFDSREISVVIICPKDQEECDRYSGTVGLKETSALRFITVIFFNPDPVNIDFSKLPGEFHQCASRGDALNAKVEECYAILAAKQAAKQAAYQERQKSLAGQPVAGSLSGHGTVFPTPKDDKADGPGSAAQAGCK
jgi:hypothetical protein